MSFESENGPETPDTDPPVEQPGDEAAEEAPAAPEGGDEQEATEPPAEVAEEPAEAGEGASESAEDADAPAEAEAPAGEKQAPAEAEAPPADQAAQPPAAERPPRDRKEQKPDAPPPGAELEPIAITEERELTAEERARLEAEAEERARREAEATAEGEAEPAARRRAAVEIPSGARIQATGKRKSSIARVVLSSGDGSFEVNRRSLEDYFPREHHRTVARQALVASGYEGDVDVRVRVHGGGISGQAGAIRHGTARALTEVDSDLRRELKRRGLLTRDARAKERRKAGLKKARKRPQFSKR